MMKELIQWSEREFSHLPWRQNRTLYRTLVSEIMLQQTTVSTVLNHYEKFLTVYPDLDSLANSTEEDLTINWKGLGYYRRARNLHKACKFFQENFKSQIPLNYEDLIKAPGIGEYTANALLAIGANKEALCVDANLERVLSRLNYILIKKGPKLIKKINEDFKKSLIASDLKEYGGRAYNEALMDLGRVYCQSRRADCLICPMSSSCESFKKGDALSIPVQEIKEKKKFYELKLIRFVVVKDNSILVYRKNKKEWLAGQNEIPTFIISSEDKKLEQYPTLQSDIDFELLPIVKTSITQYRITNHVLICSKEEFEEILGKRVNSYNFISLDDPKLNLTTASVKSINI